MKNLTRWTTTGLLISLALVFSAKAIRAQDPVQVDSKHYKVELENSQVRVLRINYGPHEKSVMHKHPAGVVVALTEQRGKFTFPNGKSQERSFTAGQTRWLPAETHLPENTGDKPFELILVEVKPGKAAGKRAAADDPLKVAAQQYKLEFENQWVRVLRVNVGPHGKVAMHQHPGNVIVFLADGRSKFTLPDGKTQEAEGKKGQVLWGEPGKHATENLSDQSAQAIIVELKTAPAPAK